MSTAEKSPDEKSPGESLSWLEELKGPPTWAQLESVLPMTKVREMTSLSDEALEGSHSAPHQAALGASQGHETSRRARDRQRRIESGPAP